MVESIGHPRSHRRASILSLTRGSTTASPEGQMNVLRLAFAKELRSAGFQDESEQKTLDDCRVLCL